MIFLLSETGPVLPRINDDTVATHTHTHKIKPLVATRNMAIAAE